MNSLSLTSSGASTRHLRSVPICTPFLGEIGAVVPAPWEPEIRAFIEWMHAAGRSSQTIRLRRHYVSRLAAHCDPVEPWDVTGDLLVAFMAYPGWQADTRKSARASIVGFYRWGYRAGRISADPSLLLGAVTSPRRRPRPVPTPVVARALIMVDNDRDRLMLLHAAYAGLRRGEIARVHPDDYSPDGLLVRGKGGNERLIPVHPDLAAAVRREVERRAAGGHGTGWRYIRGISLDGPLFPNAYGKPVGADVPGRVLSRLLGEGWTGHTLRHRFASEAYAAENDLRAVQELMGHAKPETTAGYVVTPRGALQRAVANVTVLGEIA